MVKDETKSIWNSFLKIFDREKENKVTYPDYISKTEVLYKYKRNPRTRKFPPISITIFLIGHIDYNFYAIVKVPCIRYDQWFAMNYNSENNCWKIILDFDINKDIRLKSEIDEVEIYISTD